jgi:hypothetical protein
VKSGSKSFNRTIVAVLFSSAIIAVPRTLAASSPPSPPCHSCLVPPQLSRAVPRRRSRPVPPQPSRALPFFRVAAPPLLSRAASSSTVHAASPPCAHPSPSTAAQLSLATEFAFDRRTLRPNPNSRDVFNFLRPFFGKGLSHEFDSAR